MKRLSLSLVMIACMCGSAYAGAIDTLVIINPVMPAYTELQLLSASPYENEKLDAPPLFITLTFSQPLRPDKSFIRVTDMYGRQLGESEVGPEGKDMSVALPELGPGRYSVKWRARCRCEQDTEISDTYRFTVK